MMEQVFIQAIGAALAVTGVAVGGAILTWLVKTYGQFKSMVDVQKKTNDLLTKTLNRLDKHESRLDSHESILASLVNKSHEH